VSMFSKEFMYVKHLLKCCEMLTISLRMSSWSFNITRWRVVTGVLRHDGNAFLAADTAALNSSSVVNGTCETTSCVAYGSIRQILEVCMHFSK